MTLVLLLLVLFCRREGYFPRGVLWFVGDIVVVSMELLGLCVQWRSFS